MGRVALFTALRALGVGDGDRVGICSYTCLGVVEPIVRLGATPVFLDVDRHMNIDNNAIERDASTLKALVLQHTFGVPCDLDFALEWAGSRGVPIVEDACHAVGAKWRGRAIGTFGKAAVFSFQWGKPISTGQGGMLVLNDTELVDEVDRLLEAESVPPTAKQAMSLRVQRWLHEWLVTPRTKRALRAVFGVVAKTGLVSGSEAASPNLRSIPPGFLRRMSASQARVGLDRIAKLPAWIAQRREAFAEARNMLAAAGVALPPIDARAEPAPLRIAAWLRDKPGALHAGQRAAIDLAGWYWTPAHPVPIPQLAEFGYEAGQCPSAERAFDSVVTLPTRPRLSTSRLAEAVKIMKEAI